MSDERKIEMPPLTAYEIHLLILGLKSNERALVDYGPYAHIAKDKIEEQNRDSRRLRAILQRLVPSNSAYAASS